MELFIAVFVELIITVIYITATATATMSGTLFSVRTAYAFLPTFFSLVKIRGYTYYNS